MTDCKHDWHFIEGTERLRCERCKEETGPRPYEQRVKDLLQDPWTTEHLTVPEGTGYAFANLRPNYNITFHRVVDGHNQDVVGTLDFNGPELVFTGDAAESAKVFVDCVANAFRGRLEEERKAGRKEAEQISWGIDWGREGDRDCATIIKRLPDGTAEVIAVEYRP